MVEQEEKSKEKSEKEFYETLTDYFSKRFIPTGYFNAIGTIRDHLGKLNNNLEEFNKTSTKLSEALNKLTLSGVIVAGSGVLIALAHLIFNVFKYSQGN